MEGDTFLGEGLVGGGELGGGGGSDVPGLLGRCLCLVVGLVVVFVDVVYVVTWLVICLPVFLSK